MKKLLLLTLLYLPIAAIADEGLWNIESAFSHLKGKGIALSADELYSESKPSLKDAVYSFADAGTCSFISQKGLLLTNYHLAVKFIKQHSTVANSYLDNGFEAPSPQDELECKGLFIKQQLKSVDVTAEIMDAAAKGISFSKAARAIVQRLTPKDGGFSGTVKSAFNGFRYTFYLFRTIDDIRLVYAPPYAIAKYGDEETNCSWPRRSADVAIFRAYVKGKDGACIPYEPSHFLPLSDKGLTKGDPVFAVGFPRSAMNDKLSMYLKSAAASDAYRANLMSIRLHIMKGFMQKSDSVRLQLVTLYSAVSNEMTKKRAFISSIGRCRSVELLEEREKRCAARLGQHQDSLFLTRIAQVAAIYQKADPCMPAYDYYREGIMGIWILQIAEYVKQSLKEGRKAEEMVSTIRAMYPHFNPAVDRQIMLRIVALGQKEGSAILPPEVKGSKRADAFAQQVFESSVFCSEAQLLAALNGNREVLYSDPAYRFMVRVDSALYACSLNRLVGLSQRADSICSLISLDLAKTGVAEWPNADGTLRISYGTVADSRFFTTPDRKLGKLLLKYGAVPTGNNFFPVNTTSDCHTSGGSSGSPVLDSKGSIVGLNFDRNKEGLTADFAYQKAVCRNIMVDSRYILSLIHASKKTAYLLNEITVTH